ncbi:hypothetical protein CCP1ISM_2070001 [Azospirillaceae bacterium]
MRIQAEGQKPVYSDSQVKAIVYHINNMFPYGDDRHATCMAHDVGSGLHFHLQVKPLPGYKLNMEVKPIGGTR